MTEPIQWKVTRLPRRGPKPAAPSYRELCAELTEQLDDLLARSIRTSTERGLDRTLAERILFWLDITPNEAAETLAYDTKCFELIRKARIALTLPAPTRQEDYDG